jgi:heat-inducible transcriptional repressor
VARRRRDHLAATTKPRGLAGLPCDGTVTDLRLTSRQEAILKIVVERHIATAAPIGSKNIAGQDGIDFASSTIRSELARLEALELLDHPHTSAGRVPTDTGYRYYVDHLVARSEVALAPAGIASALDVGEMRREVDAAMRRIAEAMSQVTSMLGVVTAPPAQSATIRRVEVLLLQPQLVMVVVITSTGAVTKRMFAFDAPVDPRLADWASDFLNERVVGSAVGARTLAGRLGDPSLARREQEFVGALSTALTELDDEETQGALYVGGQARFLEDHRAQDLVEIGSLMRALEERYALLHLLRGALAGNDVYLRIGTELPDPGLRGVSIVAANYGVTRRNLGTVSVIGPTRMDYRLAIATVREAAHALSAYVEEVYE